MRSALAIVLAALVVALAAPATPPITGTPGGPSVGFEQAQAQSAKRTGDRAADIGRGWIKPLLILAVGILGLVAIGARSLGMQVSAFAGAFLAGPWIFIPNEMEKFVEGVGKAIF